MTRIEEIMQQAELTVFPWDDVREQVKFEDGFIEGAKWADKTMIEKACAWLKEYGDDFGVPESESGRVYVDDLVCEFRKAMEE